MSQVVAVAAPILARLCKVSLVDNESSPLNCTGNTQFSKYVRSHFTVSPINPYIFLKSGKQNLRVDGVECCRQIEKTQGRDTSGVEGGCDFTENFQKCRLRAVKLSIY